ncbi:MAG: DUF4423 domain-containing protein [Deltaproteobacteria bacterium]|nr:DUF4423 domain-containing protein [Deltaproteobacteria bacterium]
MSADIPVDYEAAAMQFLRGLRGKRSQRALSRRLGYRGNPITDWEHGRRFPTAERAFAAALRIHLDVANAFAAFHPTRPVLEPGRPIALAPWLDALRGSTSTADVARHTGLSRFAVRRYLAGEAKPRLPDFFRLVDAITGRLPELVAGLLPIEAMPVLRPRYEGLRAARRAAYDAPWTEAVLRILESPSYRACVRHDDGFVAQRLGIDAAEVRASISLLRRANVVVRRRRLYRPRDASSVDTRGDRAQVSALLAHWTEVGRRHITGRKAPDLFAYNVFSLPDAELESARAILARAFREVRALVAAAEPGERVAVLNLQCFQLGSAAKT